MGVDVEAIALHEAEERHPERPRQVHGKAGGGADGDQDWYPGYERLLHEFEAGASTDAEKTRVQRRTALEELLPNNFVERVVAADVLPQRQQPAALIE